MLGDLLNLCRLLRRAVDFGQADVSDPSIRTGHVALNHPKTRYGYRKTVRGTFPGCSHCQNQLLIDVSIDAVMTGESRREVKEVRLRVSEGKTRGERVKYSSGAADCGKITRLPIGHAARSREPARQGKTTGTQVQNQLWRRQDE